MLASLKAEFRKLFSVRSTYVILGIGALALIFFAFYINGIRVENETNALRDPALLDQASLQAMNALAFVFSIAGLLLFAHEYRYNTIMYTLTSSNSRSRILLAKIITVTCFAVLVSAVTAILSPALSWLGIHLGGHAHDLVPQVLHVKDIAWRCLYFGWGYAMIALLLIALIRNQVGAIVALFLTPVMVEPLLSLLLKTKAVYLPFMSLGQVLAIPGADAPPEGSGHLSPGKGALVFGIYLVVGWLVAWILFVKRDAN